MQLRRVKRATAIAVLGVVAAGYVVLKHPFVSTARAAPVAPAASGAPVVEAPAATPGAVAALPDFSAIVRQYGPAVVNVSTTATMKTGANDSPFGRLDPHDPFYYFFKRFGAPVPRGEMIMRGLGSGFIVKSDGVILTNAHVVDGASEVKVKLTDKREFPAKVVGVDKATDVAVLKIAAKDLPTAKLGDASRARVGEWVLAIGSPFGFENSATAGIVSAKARSLPDEGYVPFLQTDVAVNPGNSGGPLFDLSGEVIGINSQIYSQSGGYMGLSFAIPIDVAMKVEKQLVAHGKVVRGRLGVTIQDVNQQLAESFGLAKARGALVSSVERNGSAGKAGVEPGDVILALNGKEIDSSSDLPPEVADLRPGSKARLEVWRKGARRQLEVTVGEASDAKAARAEAGNDHGRLGLSVRPLTPEEQRQAEVKGGVMVEGVTGPAARAGIEAGDVVLALDGTPVAGVEELRRLVAKAHDHVAVLVQRGEARLFVPVQLG